MIEFDRVTQFVTGSAGRIAVVDHGAPQPGAPDVLLLHGAHRNLLDWEPVRAELAGLRVVAMDLRGHGRSDPPPDGDYGWAAHLGDVAAVVEQVGLHRPYLVGQSLGGMIAVRWAAAGRDTGGIVDLDGFGGGVARLYPGLDAAEVARLRAEQLAFYQQMAVSQRFDRDAAGALLDQAAAAAEAFGWDPELAVAGARRSLVPDGAGGYLLRPGPHLLAALQAPLDGWDMFAELRTLPCPAVVVQGGRTPPLHQLPDGLRELNEALVDGVSREVDALRDPSGAVPGIRAVRLPDAAHMVHLDAPYTVAALITEFVGSTRSGAGEPPSGSRHWPGWAGQARSAADRTR